jgi:hypothetical protein
MDQALDYLRRAEHCLEEARKQQDPKMQEQLLDLAYEWTMLAVEREDFLKNRLNAGGSKRSGT